jgi:NAD(P)-dependent dehydrogenase (short-subunit alcohol dehydrogenase family)
MSNTQVALVTGANKGIGLQIAKDLAARGFIVLVGSRRLGAGQDAASSIGSNAHALQLDVTDHASIAAAAARIRNDFGRLDPNASFEEKLLAGRPSTASISETRAIFETNVFGVIAVIQAMLPLLRQAPVGRVVNVSSTVGSLTLQSDPESPVRAIQSVAYVPSKTALNAVTVAFANELQGTYVKVNAVCPGFIATDLNNFRGTGSVAEGAREAVRLALLGADGPTGTFSNDDGVVPW